MRCQWFILQVSLIATLVQGCVVWPYRTTPIVTGRVIDAVSGKPVAGATVGFSGHTRAQTHSGSDGQFSLESDLEWGPALIIPFEFTPCGGTLVVAAQGYISFERNFGEHVEAPQKLADIPLRPATPNDPHDPTP